MSNSKFIKLAGVIAGGLALATVGSPAAVVKITDPRSVVMIVNRDSNDLAFMDIKSHKMVGKVFLELGRRQSQRLGP